MKNNQAMPEEEAMANEIINGGVGKRLSEEVMSEFRTGAEWVMEIGTRVGKTLVHMYRPEGTEGKELPLLINMHGGGVFGTDANHNIAEYQ